MGYNEESLRLQRIVTSDDSTPSQRRAAESARDALIDGDIRDAFARIKARTARYNNLMSRLKDIIDRIEANQLTTVTADLDTWVQEIQPPADDD